MIIKLKYSTIAGVKDKLVARIAKRKLNTTSTERLKAEVTQYLSPTIKTKEKPLLNEMYANSFNLVDRFNRLISFISYRPRFSSECMRLLIGVIEIAIVESWVIWNDLNLSKIGENDTEKGILSFACKLSSDLEQRAVELEEK